MGDTEAVQVFKQGLMKQLKTMKFANSSAEEKSLIELDFQDGASQFIFSFSAVSVKAGPNKDIHVATSGFGKQWQQPKGTMLNKPFWDDHMDDVKAYVQHGAYKQLKLAIQ